MRPLLARVAKSKLTRSRGTEAVKRSSCCRASCSEVGDEGGATGAATHSCAAAMEDIQRAASEGLGAARCKAQRRRTPE